MCLAGGHDEWSFSDMNRYTHKTIAGVFVAAMALTASPLAAETGIEVLSAEAAKLPRVHSLIVAQDGKEVLVYAKHGWSLDRPANIKSVSKTIISLLVGMAIDKGLIDGPEQPLATLLSSPLPSAADPRVNTITVGNFLSMQTGLERTSGRNYGRWVQSKNWVDFVLSRPFVDEPGGGMLYSSGSSHVLSALLTKISGKNTWALADEWLAKPLGITIPKWQTDPQGIYFGGNNMTLSPRGLLRIGELYRNGGRHQGRQLISESWIKASWMPRTASRFTGHGYGYGWFMTEFCGHTAYYGRGFGGQFLYVLPSLKATVVITSNPNIHSRQDGYWWKMRDLMEGVVVPGLAVDASGMVACGT